MMMIRISFALLLLQVIILPYITPSQPSLDNNNNNAVLTSTHTSTSLHYHHTIFDNPPLLLDLISHQHLRGWKNFTCLTFKENSFLIYKKHRVWLDRYSRSMVMSYMRCRSVYLNEFDRYSEDIKMKSLFDGHANQYILSLGASSFVVDTRRVFKGLQNPSFVFWNDSIIVSWRIRRTIMRIARIPLERLEGKASSVYGGNLSQGNVENMLSALESVDFHDKDLTHLPLYGEDPRLITMPADASKNESVDRLYVVYAMRFQRTVPEIWMYYCELFVDANTTLRHHRRTSINFKAVSSESQKNWSPFVAAAAHTPNKHKGSLLFVAAISPEHRIVRTVPIPHYNFVEGEIAAHTRDLWDPMKNVSHIWQWGELRGGTPAILVDPLFYLSFFHSSNVPSRQSNWLQTYVFGAYTFCPVHPYKILKISSSPIVHPSMYEGPWVDDPIAASYIDYVVFPMAFVLSDGYIFLSYGAQDSDGWIAKLDYKALLDSLVVINESC